MCDIRGHGGFALHTITSDGVDGFSRAYMYEGAMLAMRVIYGALLYIKGTIARRTS